MNISRILRKEMKRSEGNAEVVVVPNDRRPTAQSLKRLDLEISAQIEANEVMRTKSMLNASKMSRE